MSLLDQMKRQAQDALDAQEANAKLSAETIGHRNRVLRDAFDYWREFSNLTNVIQPEFPYGFQIPRVGEMKQLKLMELFADFRYKVIGHHNFSDEIDYATLYFFYKSDQVLTFQRDIEVASLVEDSLWRYGITHTTEHVKNELHRLVAVDFKVPCVIKGSVTLSVVEEKPEFKLHVKNAAKLGEMELFIPFQRVNEALLDELSKLIMGQDEQFWKTVRQ